MLVSWSQSGQQWFYIFSVFFNEFKYKHFQKKYWSGDNFEIFWASASILTKWLILWNLLSNWLLEETDFFHEICLIALYASRAVKFTAVVDSNGKLILGKFKKINMRRHRSRLPYPSVILEGSKQQQHQSLSRQSCHSFYHDHLTPTLKAITSRSYREQWSDKAHFEIIEIDSKIGAKLAVTPLTERRDRYLCVYLQLSTEITTDQHQQIISKIINAIQ